MPDVIDDKDPELVGLLAEAVVRLRAMPLFPKIPGLIKPPAKWPIEQVAQMANELNATGGTFEDRRGFLEMLFWAHLGLQMDDMMAKSEAACLDVCAVLKRRLEAKTAELETVSKELEARRKLG